MTNVIPMPQRRKIPASGGHEDIEGLTLNLLRAARDAPGAPKLRAAMLRVFGAERAAQLHDDMATIAGAAGPPLPEMDVSPIETAMLHALAEAQRSPRNGSERGAPRDGLSAAIARVASALCDRDLYIPEQTQADPRGPANEYERAPMPTTRLSSPQMLFLQGVRFSAEQLLNGSEDYDELLRAYAKHGAGGAAPALFGLARIIGRTAYRPVTIHCFCCCDASGDEQALIEAVGALQLGDRETAMMIFAEFLPPLAAQFAIEPARGIADGFSEAEYRLA